MKDIQVNSDIGIRLLTLYNQLKNTGQVKSQKDFAQKIGVSPALITEIKNGRSRISATKLQQIKGEYSKYKEWLITGKNSPFESGEFAIDELNIRTVERLSDGRYVIPESLWIDYMKRVEQHNENEEKLSTLEKEIKALKDELSSIKKTVAPGEDAACADVG